MLDHTAFPHIMDTILDSAPYDSLVVLRATSKAMRDAADRRMFAHLVFPGDGLRIILARGSLGSPLLGRFILRKLWFFTSALCRAVRVIDTFPLQSPRDEEGLKVIGEYLPTVDVLRQRGYRYAPQYPTSLSAKTVIFFVDIFPRRTMDWIVPEPPYVPETNVNHAESLIIHYRYATGQRLSHIPTSLDIGHDIKTVTLLFSNVSDMVTVARPSAELYPAREDSSYIPFLTSIANFLGEFIMEPPDLTFTLIGLEELPKDWLGWEMLEWKDEPGRTAELEAAPDDARTTFKLAIKDYCRYGLAAARDKIDRRVQERIRFLSSEEWQAEIGARMWDLVTIE